MKLINKNIHNDNNNPKDNSVYVDKIKINVKILDTYDIYNVITIRTIGTIGKTKFVRDNNNTDKLQCASCNIMMIK